LVDLAEAALLCADAAGEIAEVVDRQRNVGRHGFAHRLAVVQVSAVAISSRLASMRSAMRAARSALGRRGLAPLARGMGGIERQLRCPSRWNGVPAQNTLPVTGVRFSKYCPSTGATHWPPMKLSYSLI
jgi:hypothetical protein